MAVAVREVTIANPARKRRNVARKQSLKQKAAFGTKRVRAAAKAALSRQRKRKRNPSSFSIGHKARSAYYRAKGAVRDALTKKSRAAARRRNPPGRVITGYGSTVMNPRKRHKRNPARKVISGYGSTVMNPRRRKKRNPSGKTNVVFNPARKRRKRATGSVRRKNRRRTNPGEIFALVNPNPATKGRKSMARTRRKTNRRRKNAAGSTRRHSRRRMNTRHRRRSNPGGAVVKDWLSLGAGAVVGGVGATQLPQLVLSTSNTGAIGYLANMAATGILAAAAHMLMKGNKALVAGIIAGGVGATIKRVIGDYSLLGSYGASLGMGDYLTNLNPQYTFLPTQSTAAPSTAAPVAVNVAGAGGGMGYLSRPLY